MSRGYETLYIIKPKLGDDINKKVIEKVQKWITSNKGEILLHKEIGTKDLATNFEDFTQGYYVQVQFNATNETLDELNSKLRVNEEILRYLTVTLESVTVEPAKVVRPALSIPFLRSLSPPEFLRLQWLTC